MAIKTRMSDDERAEYEQAREALRTLDVIDVPTLALVLQQAEQIVRKGIADGDIPSIRIGRSFRIPTAPIRRMLGIDGA